jgi:two-component system, cell cycle sensor histidine kinase and response regulator CckA
VSSLPPNKGMTDLPAQRLPDAVLVHALRSINECVSITDHENRILYVNDAFLRTYGYTEEELLGNDIAMVLSDKNPFKNREIVPATLDGGWIGELVNRRKDGTDFPIHLSTSVLKDAKNHPIALIGVATDISERNRKEEELQMFRFSIDEASDAVYWLDEQARITYVNDEACRSLGYTREQLTSLQLWDIDPNYPKERWAVRWKLHQENEQDKTERLETTHRRSDGTDIPVEIVSQHIWFGEQPLHVAYARDITSRKQAEGALRASEAQLSSAAIIAHLGSWEYDVTKDLFLFNDQFYALLHTTAAAEGGYAMSSAQYAQRFVHPEERELVGREIGKAIETNDAHFTQQLEHRILYADGGIGHVTVRIFIAKDKDGRTIKTHGVNQDITVRKKSNEALRLSEDKFKRAFHTNPDSININRLRDGMYVEFNQGFLDMTGYAKEDIVGKTSLELNIWADPEDRKRLLQGLKQDGEVKNLEAKFRTKSGKLVSGLMSASIIDVGGEQCILTITRDITERKASEELLKRSLAWQEEVFEGSRDAIFLSDASARFIAVNNAACTLTGYSRAELLDMHIPELHEHMDLDAYRQYHGKIMAGEESVTEAKILRKNGTKVETEFSNRRIVIGGVPYMHTAARDISTRKEFEEALKRSEEKYRQFFEQDLTGDFITTVDGEIIDCNPAFAQIFGFASADEARHKNVTFLYSSPDKRTKVLDLLRDRKKLEYYEYEARRVDGTPLFLIENLIGIFDDGDRLTHIRAYVFDNTERKSLEQQLLHAQKMESIGTLASGIAHDFNNVLNNIIGFAQQIRKYPGDHDRIIRYSDTIEQSAFRGADLAKRLLMFGRKRKRENEITGIDGVVDEIVQLTNETFPKSIVVQKELDHALKPVFSDRGELYQAILNICLNSRDALLERENPAVASSIIIRAHNRGTANSIVPELFRRQNERNPICVEIAISDNGVGMSGEILGKIFDPFFTTKERGKGTGLGLAVVYNIVKNNGGAVTVESKVGEGTVVHLFLPAAETNPPTPNQAEAGGIRTASLRNVLLVDDDEMMRELGTELLRENGYCAIIAKDGTEAIATYRERWEEISLVILDVAMPGMDGGEVYTRLRKINPRVKAFFCTGYIHDDAIGPILEGRKVRALEKPFNPVDFRRMVNEVISS